MISTRALAGSILATALIVLSGVTGGRTPQAESTNPFVSAAGGAHPDGHARYTNGFVASAGVHPRVAHSREMRFHTGGV